MERISRLCAVTFVVIGGLVHLELWRTGYRSLPNVGTAFLANVVLAGVIGLAVLIRNNRWVNLAGIAFSIGSLVALGLSRTVGFLGFTEKTWTEAAAQATTAEVGAIVAFAALLLASRHRADLAPATVRR